MTIKTHEDIIVINLNKIIANTNLSYNEKLEKLKLFENEIMQLVTHEKEKINLNS